MPRTRLFWTGTGVLLLVIALVAFLGYRYGGTAEPVTIAFSEFLGDVKAGRVKSVTVAADALAIERHDGTRVQAVAPPGYVASNPTFVTGLAEDGVRVDVTRVEPSRVGSFGALALGLAYVLIWEGILSGLFAGTQAFSIRQATLALAAALSSWEPSQPTMDVGSAVVVVAGALVGALAISTWRMSRYEVRGGD